MTSFSDLGVAEPLRRALENANYVRPTPIQERAIPLLLEGKDLFGVAQTGTGKTAAFALPMLQRLAARGPRQGRGASALILAPTRELVVQIAAAIRTYGRHLKLREAAIYGGVSQGPQVKALQRGIDILVATPGRLLDLINQGHARLDTVSLLVLDEADRMLDMGFIHDVRKIVGTLPRQRQSMLFSATMPAEITRLAADMLREPVRVEVAPTGTAAEFVEQKVFHIAAAEKRALLGSLLRDPAMSRVIVFTRTKHGANRVAEQLGRGGVSAAAIHGNKSQSARQAALNDFRAGRSRVLVATDIAARGIDVEAVTHIVNYELPNVPETYIHRIGRTARAGAGGAALSFCDAAERAYLRDIERLIRRRIVVAEQPAGRGAAATSTMPGAAPAARLTQSGKPKPATKPKLKPAGTAALKHAPGDSGHGELQSSRLRSRNRARRPQAA